MKKLLLISLVFILLVSLISCSNYGKKRSATAGKNTTEVKQEIKPEVMDTVKSDQAVVKMGDTVTSSSSNTQGSTKGGHYKKQEIEHKGPNQAAIDSIKREKTKRKK